MVRSKKYRSINKRRIFRSKRRGKKSRKHLKSKKKHDNVSRNHQIINGNVSGYIHQIKCENNICSEYKQQLNSVDDLNKLFGLFKI
jgi:transposase